MRPLDLAPLSPIQLDTPRPGLTRDVAAGGGFRSTLARGLAGASQVASAVLPGGPLVGAALTGLSQLVAPDAAAAAPDMASVMAESRSFNLQYLALQQEMAQESRTYTTLSNIMKARHEAARNAINNIR